MKYRFSQEALYSILEGYRLAAAEETVPSVVASTVAFVHWKANDWFVQPWEDAPHNAAQQAAVIGSSYPLRCSSRNVFSP